MQTTNRSPGGGTIVTLRTRLTAVSQFRCGKCGGIGSAPTHRVDCPDAQRRVSAVRQGDVIAIDGIFPARVLTAASGGRYGISRVTTRDLSGGPVETRDYPPFASVTVIGRAA